ncbi:MAG: hypothetical protein LBS22_00790 [Puniceicoccales bacterium]|jgi:hypothetical protein|nr:hypothetical protein [Puniceicoccales bacterium]
MPDFDANSVAVAADGYAITQAARDGVVNPFLDLEEAEAKNALFYFLEGHYDQIILEKIFTILYSTDTGVQSHISAQTEALDAAQKAYYDAAQKASTLQILGAYGVEGLITNIETAYSVNGVVPTKNAVVCTTAINDASADALAIVRDLLIANITLPNIPVVGEPELTALRTLEGQLYEDLEPHISAIVAALGTYEYENQFQIPDATLNDLETALNGTDDSIATHKSSIQSAIAAYKEDKTSGNLEDLQTALSVATNDGTFTSVVATNSALGLAIDDVNGAIARIVPYYTAINSINAFIANAPNQNRGDFLNLQAALNTISNTTDYPEFTNITTTSMADLASVVNAMTGIQYFRVMDPDEDFFPNVKTYYLDGIKDISFLSPETVSSINAMATLIDTSIALNSWLYSARSSIENGNVNDIADNLQRVSATAAAIQNIPGMNYDYTALVTAINTALNTTENIRSILNTLTLAITAYSARASGATPSLTGDPSVLTLFDAVDDALEDFSDEIRANFSTSTITGYETRVTDCNAKIDSVSDFKDFYRKIDSLIAIYQNTEVKELLTSPTPRDTYYTSATGAVLKTPLIFTDLKALSAALQTPLKTISDDIEPKRKALEEAQAKLNEVAPGFDPNASLDDLLNLCMMASTPQPQANDTYRLVTGIQRTLDANGNYTYALVYGGSTITKAQYDASFSKEDGYTHYSLPYLALAIMYEKVGIQQMVLVEQLKQVEKINEAIRENNNALKALSVMYDRVYSQATTESHSSSWYFLRGSTLEEATGVSIPQLIDYLTTTQIGIPGADNICGLYRTHGNYPEGAFQVAINRYDRDGDAPTTSSEGCHTQNVDVHEQATLTQISNKQDAVRIYGDQLSTDSQLMTTKMSQYMQNSNACVSACTQVVKSVGDYLKTVVSNIR